MNKKILIFGIVVLSLVALFIIKPVFTGSVIGGEDEIKIPLSNITSQAKFYEYNGIRYFVVKANDGSIKTAFDACDVCYYSEKGYSQDGDFMVCNNCGNRYPISGLGTENLRGGGCWPGYLPSRIEKDNLIIKVKEINEGEYRFK